jgi:hypothetical protein
MAASILGKKQQMKLASFGQNGRMMEWGQATFSTTDANGDIPCNMRYVESVIPVPIGTPNTDETLFWNNTVNGDGGFVVPSSGLINIGRTGTKTSGLKFSYLIIGY